VIGPGQSFLTRVRSIFLAGRVGSAIYGLGLENVPLNPKFSTFCPSGQKKSHQVARVKKYPSQRWVAVSYLLRLKSILGSGQVRDHLYSLVNIRSNQNMLFNLWPLYFKSKDADQRSSPACYYFWFSFLKNMVVH